MLSTTKGTILSAALGLAILLAPAAGQAAPAIDLGLAAVPATELEQVQYRPESYQHYQYRRAHADYRRARSEYKAYHRAYRNERYYRYGY